MVGSSVSRPQPLHLHDGHPGVRGLLDRAHVTAACLVSDHLNLGDRDGGEQGEPVPGGLERLLPPRPGAHVSEAGGQVLGDVAGTAPLAGKLRRIGDVRVRVDKQQPAGRCDPLEVDRPRGAARDSEPPCLVDERGDGG